MSSIDDLIAKATPRTRTVPVYLRGDLRDEWDEVRRQLAEAEADKSALYNEKAVALREQAEALHAQAEESRIDMKLRSVGTNGGKVAIARAGRDTNDPETWRALIKACLIDPTLTGEQFTRLFGDDQSDGVLDLGQVLELFTAANALCFGDKSVPTMPAGSDASRTPSEN